MGPEVKPLWHIFVNFMEKEPYTKFRGVLRSNNKTMKLQSFEFDLKFDVYLQIYKIFHPWFSLLSFANFKEKEHSNNFHGAFDHF